MRRRTISLFHVCVLVVLFLSFVVVCYLLYVSAKNHRIADNRPLDIVGTPSGEILKLGKIYRLAAWDIGFASQTPSFSSYFEEGMMQDGTATKGRFVKAPEKSMVEKNLDDIISQTKSLDASIILLSEVDEKASRSHQVNQKESFIRAMEGFESVWAKEIHTAYLPWPLTDPIGATNSGLVTLSQHPMDQAWRKSIPVEENLYGIDPCLSVSSLPIENGKTLYVINIHMGGKQQEAQWRSLVDFMCEVQEAGDYAICGGDFGPCITPTSFASGQEVPTWAKTGKFPLPENMQLCFDKEVPTTRSTDIPWREGITYTTITDGFVTTRGVHAKATTKETDFAWSHHQPVILDFILE